MSRLVLGAGIAAAAMLHGPSAAMAQAGPGGAPPSAAAKQTARKLVDDGIAAQDAGQYDKAIDLFKQAYALVPHPVLMFNIAQAHRLAGRHDQAVPFYERYLSLDPNGPQAPAAKAALAAILAASSAGNSAKGLPVKPEETTQPGATTPPAPTGTDAAPAPAPPSSPTPPALDPGPENRTDSVGSPGRTLRITGLALGGVGLASAAVGLYFSTRVLAYESDAKEARMNMLPLDDIERKGKDAERNQDIAYIVAGGLIVGGAVTYWLGYRRDQAAPTTAWTPVVGPGFTGIALSGLLP